MRSSSPRCTLLATVPNDEEDEMSAVQSSIARRSATLQAALGAIALSTPLLAIGAWGDDSEANPTRRFLVTLAVAAAVAIPVFAWAVPRARRLPGGNTAIILAVAALLSLGVYWLGPTLVVALGAITAGLASPTGWARRGAMSLGAAAAVAFVVVTFLQIG
jgi:hypothetical protein